MIIAVESQSENSHIGIITSKSVGNAVVRNKARRRIRSIFSGQLINFIHPYDIVIIARSAIATATHQQIEFAIAELLVKAGILPK
jgi:ribonuclease P protein component